MVSLHFLESLWHEYSEVKVWPLGKMCTNLVRPRPVIPPHTITFALCFAWYAGGTSHSWEPHTMLFSGLGYWNRYLLIGHSSVNKKSLQSSAVSLDFDFLANLKRALLCLSLRSGIFFRLKVAWVSGVSGEKGKDGSEKGREVSFSPFPLPHRKAWYSG